MKKKKYETKKKKREVKTKKYGKKEIADFKKLLLQRKSAILEEINHISGDTLKQSQKEASGDISGYSYHMADVATDNYDREFSLGLASNERKILYEIDAALRKIDDGSFGVCESCSSLITKKRLSAVPHARTCIKCQEAQEKVA